MFFAMSADLFLLMQDYLKKKKTLGELRLRIARDGVPVANTEYQQYQRAVEQARETFTLACHQG
jgi:hypothetical protein